jgi:hypothetical protein
MELIKIVQLFFLVTVRIASVPVTADVPPPPMVIIFHRHPVLAPLWALDPDAPVYRPPIVDED